MAKCAGDGRASDVMAARVMATRATAHGNVRPQFPPAPPDPRASPAPSAPQASCRPRCTWTFSTTTSTPNGKTSTHRSSCPRRLCPREASRRAQPPQSPGARGFVHEVAASAAGAAAGAVCGGQRSRRGCVAIGWGLGCCRAVMLFGRGAWRATDQLAPESRRAIGPAAAGEAGSLCGQAGMCGPGHTTSTGAVCMFSREPVSEAPRSDVCVQRPGRSVSGVAL